MFKLFALILALAPAALHCQSSVIISPEQCVYRGSHNPLWSAPTLDETGWEPYSKWRLNTKDSQEWVRCNVSLSALAALRAPAIQVTVAGAYELFLDGRRIGTSGDLRSGRSEAQHTLSWPVEHPIADRSALIALHVVRRNVLPGGAAELQAGDLAELNAFRDEVEFAAAKASAPMAACYLVMAAIGLALLGFYASDRSRRELALLCICCVAIATLRLVNFAQIAGGVITPSKGMLLFEVANLVLPVAEVLFFFQIAARRVPRLMVFLLGVNCVWPVLTLYACITPRASTAYGLLAVLYGARVFGPYMLITCIMLGCASVMAFWPPSRLPGRVRPLAAVCLLWVLADAVWFGLEIISIVPSFPDLFHRWYNVLAQFRGYSMFAVVIALIGLLLREQRNIAEERAALAGEMQAGREIQQYLIPKLLPHTPGLVVDSVYVPSREVGGDFFQVLPDSRDGSTLIVIGDVAGKGLRAGMLSALIVGAIRTAFSFTNKPGEILGLLNERLQGRGLVTCLALRIDRSGAIEMANAGQLPPYLNGKELESTGDLPLGAVPGLSFSTTSLLLEPGDSMVLLSDGVVEARNGTGELFGFARTAAISTQGPAEIARAAQAHGQDDDITVVRFTFEGAEVSIS